MSIVGLDSYVAHTGWVDRGVGLPLAETCLFSQCNECRSLLVPSFYLLCGDVLLGEGWIASATEGTGMTEVSCLPHRCIVTGPKTSW